MNQKMKRNTFVTIAIVTLVLVIMEYAIVSNKGKEVVAEEEPRLFFSHEAGFYDEEFELEIISNKAGEIYYTLDGSTPDKNSMLYECPVVITDASTNDNVYSMRTDVSVGFLNDEIEQYSTAQGSMGYTVPDYKVDKATIVRAVVYYNEFSHSEIETATYFVGFSDKKGYDGMNVLSIVTDPDNLFDYETGIYVTGAAFDEYWENETEGDNTPSENWLWWDANYRNKGKEWEREACCQFFDENGEMVLSQECGIRVHGGISRGQNPKALNVYARKSYDGNNKLQYDFWNSDFYPSAITVSQGGNDFYAELKDSLFSKILEGTDVAISLTKFEPYIMFLDGEYWGVYWLCEKYNKEYLEHYYGVDSHNVIMVKNGELAAGDQEGFRLWENMVYTCETLDVTQEENYATVCDLVDIDSYIDYYAVMIYAGRTIDWPNSNYEAWRTKGIDNNQEYSDGKWRWMVFDMNSPGMSTEFIELDSIEYVMKKNEMFCNLMKNDEFRLKLLGRIEELGRTVFDSEKVNTLIDEHVELMMEPLICDQKRFFGKESEDKVYSRVNPVREFYQKRYAYIEEILDKYETIR